MDKITQAAATARALFLLNEWTWRGAATPPSQLDLEATFSSLRWDIENVYGDEKGRTRFATSGRLTVLRTPDGEYRYSVNV